MSRTPSLVLVVAALALPGATLAQTGEAIGKPLGVLFLEEGILEEGEEDMKDAKDPDVLDAGMIADAQAVEHYEIARYGTMIAWAEQLGMRDAVPLLQETLEQEYNADRTLTEIAESSLNRQAAA